MQLSKDTPAIVTGGASGLGRATAAALVEAGVPVAIFDINDEAGNAAAEEIGASYYHVNILDEDSVIAGFEAARAAQGQERICVHCAMASTRGKTLAYDKEKGGYKKLDTETYAMGVAGVLVASFRVASHSALGMASLDPIAAHVLLASARERVSILFVPARPEPSGRLDEVMVGVRLAVADSVTVAPRAPPGGERWARDAPPRGRGARCASPSP